MLENQIATRVVVYIKISLFLDINDCMNSYPQSPCMNNGVCIDGINSYTCDCTHGFIGEKCSISKHYSIWFIAIIKWCSTKFPKVYDFLQISMTVWKNLVIIMERAQMESPTTLVLALLVILEVTASIVCLNINLNYHKHIPLIL